MTKITQNDFDKRTISALKLEPMRFELYEMGLELIRSKYEIEAYLLILATWNFARFRYVTRSFDLNKFRKIINKTAPIFAKLATEKLKTADLDAIAGDIKFIYEEFKSIVEQTGASKIMHFKLPELFVMWDTEIRRIYRVSPGCSPGDYLGFLRHMKDLFGHLEWNGRERAFAKAIDEYNFDLAHGDDKKKKPRSSLIIPQS